MPIYFHPEWVRDYFMHNAMREMMGYRGLEAGAAAKDMDTEELGVTVNDGAEEGENSYGLANRDLQVLEHLVLYAPWLEEQGILNAALHDAAW